VSNDSPVAALFTSRAFTGARNVTAPINLDVIEIPLPCAVPWESMQGDDKVRHCSQCNQNVYHLSNMSKAEAEELIRSNEGKLCARFYRRPDGSVVTRECGTLKWTMKWSRRIFNCVVFVCLAILSFLFCGYLLRQEQEDDVHSHEPFSFVCQGAIVP
jgi:hypothetical protein